MTWHKNTGTAPHFTKVHGDEVCPAHLLALGERFMVRFRNGRETRLSWPRDSKPPTRWSLTGAPFDITEWAKA